MDCLEKNIFKIHPPMEFLYTLFAVGTEKHYYNMIKDFNLEPKKEMVTIIESLKKEMSNYMRKELEYFFDLSGIGYIFYQYIVIKSDITDIKALLQSFYEYSPIDLMFRIVRSVCKNSMPKQETPEYEFIKHDLPKMIELVTETEFQDEVRKERVTESLKNPEETKHRLYFFLTQFYNHCYVLWEETIYNCILKEKEKYEAIFKDNPSKFTEQYLNIDYKENQNSTICLSFFKYIGWHYYSEPDKSEDCGLFVLGIYSNLLYDEELSAERYANYFKTLSDPNRIAIVKLLVEKPWYGQELAEKLGITPATVSYHMTFLQKAGFISFERMDNRSYYCLNKSKLIKLIQNFIDFLN